jgi:hypothetical protein
MSHFIRLMPSLAAGSNEKLQFNQFSDQCTVVRAANLAEIKSLCLYGSSLHHLESHMNQLNLPKQDSGTIHTPAIFDSQPEFPETRANTGFPQSTDTFGAVHDCGHEKPSVLAGAAGEVGQ